MESYLHTQSNYTDDGGQAKTIHAYLVSRGTRDTWPRKRRPRPLKPPLYPPPPAGTHGGAALVGGAVLGVHARTQNEGRKMKT